MKKKNGKAAWPCIRQRGNSWQVDTGKALGKRIRKTFSDPERAESFAAEMRTERANQSAIASHERRNRAVSLGRLSDTQRSEVIQAYDLLGSDRGLVDAVRQYREAVELAGSPAGLVEAVQFFKQHSAPKVGAAPLRTVFDAFIESKRTAGRRPRTINNALAELTPFVNENGDRLVHTITTADIEAYINDRGYEGTTRMIYRRSFVGLFNYAIKRGHIDINPASAIEKPAIDQPMPVVHSIDDVKRLLYTAAEQFPVMVPYLALGYFAGLRPENELTGLDWRDVNLEDGWIRVTPATAKKRRQRYVDVSGNLKAWLAEHAKSDGKIFFSRRYLRKAREAAGITWGHDVMRHSYASYHVAAHQDAAKTAAQLGHAGDVSVLFNHYRNLVLPKDAQAYWKIMPARTTNVIHLHSGQKNAARKPA